MRYFPFPYHWKIYFWKKPRFAQKLLAFLRNSEFALKNLIHGHMCTHTHSHKSIFLITKDVQDVHYSSICLTRSIDSVSIKFNFHGRCNHQCNADITFPVDMNYWWKCQHIINDNIASHPIPKITKMCISLTPVWGTHQASRDPSWRNSVNTFQACFLQASYQGFWIVWLWSWIIHTQTFVVSSDSRSPKKSVCVPQLAKIISCAFPSHKYVSD